MTMPHKICPRCGQPAVLAMTQCRRCGCVYTPGPPAASVSPAAPNSGEMPRAQRTARQRSSAAMLIVLVLGLFLFGAIVRSGRHVDFAAGRMPGGSALNSGPADSASPPGSLSLFVESESRQEMPALTFRNLAIGTLTLTLRDRYGHVYRASSSQEELASLQVPAGDYSVSIENDNSLIRSNWGDASFRKFKSYHADFVIGHSNRRIHLGD